MKRFSTFVTLIAITVLISACGAPATPTVNPLDIANTAQAAAFTMIAQTQAAIPTATLPPPTEAPTQTPLPTNTPLALPTVPTLAVLPSPTTASASNSNASGDPCATRVIGKPLGQPTTIRIWNSTKTPVTVSLYLNETKGHQECGYRSYNLAKNGDVIITDLVYGCYNIWAWNTSGKPNFNSSGEGCINNPDKWTFIITTATINLQGP